MRRPSALLLVPALSAAALGARARQAAYGGSPLFAVMGMPGPAANAGRRCERFFQRRSAGVVPTGEVCYGPQIRGAGRLHRQEEAAVALDTRRVLHVSREWAVADTAAWARTQDSAARALAAAGGRERADCDFLGPRPPARTHIRAVRYWRFPAGTVRLTAYDLNYTPKSFPGITPSPGNPVPDSPWELQLDGYPEPADPLECGAHTGRAGAPAA